jgi:hypothetical protein
MKQIGYSLVQVSTGTELQLWSDLPSLIAIPDELVSVACPDVGWEFGDNKLVVRMLDDPGPQPGQVASTQTVRFDGTQTVVTQTYVAAPVLPPVVPSAVTPVQGRIALRRAGLIDAVKAAVAASSGEAQDWFEYATIWERDNPMLDALGTQLGLKSEQIDGLFIQAAAIV